MSRHDCDCTDNVPVNSAATQGGITDGMAEGASSAPRDGADGTETRFSDMPLAMAYVKWQSWDTTYDTATGLRRGTIFPGLDLPFLAYRGCRDE